MSRNSRRCSADYFIVSLIGPIESSERGELPSSGMRGVRGVVRGVRGVVRGVRSVGCEGCNIKLETLKTSKVIVI